MSSGSKGDPSLSGQQFVGFGEYRSWNGGNGPVETLPSGKIRSKWNNFTMTRGLRRRTSNQWTCTRKSNGTTFGVTADVSAPMGIESPFPANLDLRAQTRLVEQIRGHSFNLAVNAAQSKQLASMVVSNLGKLGRSFLALRRGDFATAARQLGARPRTSTLVPSDISGRWLELQYGWLPALQDTWEAAKAFEELSKRERGNVFRASAKSVSTREAHVSGVWGSAKETVISRISYTYEMYEQLTVARSLGLMNPLSVAWELIPYSFVVDWFVPIGTYLDNLAILPFLNGRWLKSKSTERIGRSQLVYKGTLPGFFGGELCSKVEYLGSDTGRTLYVERTVGSGALVTARPSFDASGLHGRRIWNAIALAHQRFR